MKRLEIRPRPDWQRRVEQVGLVYHTVDGEPYWDESVCYELTAAEVDMLEAVTEELQRLCLQAGQFVLDRNRLAEFGIPGWAAQAIRDTWEMEPPSIYGRFDLAYDGRDPPKLLEYNANTPTGLLEASVAQWDWRREVFPATDQFNSIHEKLIDKWSELKRYLRSDTLHFTSMANDEDVMTVTYLRDTAQQGGIRTKFLLIPDIGWHAKDRTFRDREDREIHSLFALYPWEWLLADAGDKIMLAVDRMDWIEPIWKMLWSNKALLAILWDMFPGHRNLLPAYLDGARNMTHFVRKPLLSREGANITVYVNGNQQLETDGPYGGGPFVYQQLAPGWNPEKQTPVLGSWYITDRGAAGIGIRESHGITTNTSRFVPHYFSS
jgi:glutathionylspermidine synthase